MQTLRGGKGEGFTRLCLLIQVPWGEIRTVCMRCECKYRKAVYEKRRGESKQMVWEMLAKETNSMLKEENHFQLHIVLTSTEQSLRSFSRL